MTIYSCPPVEALNHCTSFCIEFEMKESTTFLFLKGGRKFRLTLKNEKFKKRFGCIEFDFYLKEKHCKFLAIEKTNETCDHEYFEKAFKNGDKAFNYIDKSFKKIFGDKHGY